MRQKAAGKVTGEEIPLYFDRNLEVLKMFLPALSDLPKSAEAKKSQDEYADQAEIFV